MRKIINILEKMLKQLELLSCNNVTCKHNLEELRYYYDDDWGHRGSLAWGYKYKEMTFMYCKNCGQVFVKERSGKNE